MMHFSCFFRNPRPVLVEPLDQNDETDGLPEIFFQKTSELMKYVQESWRITFLAYFLFNQSIFNKLTEKPDEE